MTAGGPTGCDWLKRLSGDDDSPVAMVCFPPAGGGALGYRPWAEPLRGKASLHAVALPGREHRLREESARALNGLVLRLADALGGLVDRPLLIFGHSFGALLAFEVIHCLLARGAIAPERLHFFASGRTPPHLGSTAPRVSHLGLREIVFEVARLHGNIPQPLLEQSDFVEMIGRALKADLQMNENYRWEERPPLPCALTALGGMRDPVVTREDLLSWKRHAGTNFASFLFEGDHFYFRAPAGQRALLEIVARCCAELEASGQART